MPSKINLDVMAIKTAYAEVKSTAKMAEQFRVSDWTIKKVLKDVGVQLTRGAPKGKSHKRKIAVDQIAATGALYAEKASTIELGEKYEVAARTIGNALSDELGVYFIKLHVWLRRIRCHAIQN